MQDSSNLLCQQPGCPLATSGTCLEGVDDPHKCPHVVAAHEKKPPELSVGEDDERLEPLGEDASDWLSVPGGYELTVQEADAITGQEPAAVIVFAGEPEAGKTTLLATVYELLSEGSIPGFTFAGTETILAFERACFPSRIASNNQKPKTDRTTHMRPRFYHLCVRQESLGNQRRHLLLGDISGEAFQRASDNEAEAKKLHFLKRANTFVLILDGDRLRVKTERQDVVQRALLIVRSLLAVGVLLRSMMIQIVVSKMDCFDRTDANSNAFLGYMKEEFQRQFASSFDHFAFSEIAARPENETLDFGFGVVDLFLPWASEPESYWVETPRFPPADRQIREAEAYLWRKQGANLNA